MEINGKLKKYRDRKDEILFMDLRRWGSHYEKKYVELTDDKIQKVGENYHNWQQVDYEETYKDIPEFCYSAHFDEVAKNDFSLVPSKYIEFVDKDAIDFDSEMSESKRNLKYCFRRRRFTR